MCVFVRTRVGGGQAGKIEQKAPKKTEYVLMGFGVSALPLISFNFWEMIENL